MVSAYSGTEGLLVHGRNVDLILLDLMLPGKSGSEIIEDLRKIKDVPVIVMSAVSDFGSKVDMFGKGADDYITKPFHNEELLARINARFKEHRTERSEIKVGGLDIKTDELLSVLMTGRYLFPSMNTTSFLYLRRTGVGYRMKPLD